MQSLTDDGRLRLAAIAARHHLSTDAAGQLVSALAAGGGRQAQFNHPDLGGMGQWSQGGMIMIGDMFNNGLKARVAALCSDLAEALAGSKLFLPSAHDRHWPEELGTPTSSGSQNDLHYAIFPGTHRLAIAQRGVVTVYDTGDHHIGGVSQQQSSDRSLQFTSQSGVVRLADLPVVGDPPLPPDEPLPAATEQPEPAYESVPIQSNTANGGSDEEVFSRLERLADLHRRDIITTEEFATKKAELLARL